MENDHVAQLHRELPEDNSRDYILAYVDRVPATNRQRYAQWILNLVHTPKKDGEPRKTASVYRALHGPQRLLEAIGEKPLGAITNEDFLMAFMVIKKEPTRTFKQCRKGPLTKRTLNDYQRECRRFIVHLHGRQTADKICSFEKAAPPARDLLSEIVPWQRIHAILQDLAGMNRVLFILATFTGLRTDEIRNIKLKDIWFESTEVLIRVAGNGYTRSVPIYMLGGAVRAYLQKIRTYNPDQIYLFQRKKYPEPLQRQDVWVRVNKWGKRNGVEGLSIPRLRTTYCAWLLSRGDVNEHFVQHLQGVRKDEGVKALATAVAQLQSGEHAYDFGSPVVLPEEFRPGTKPCVDCGKLDNPIDPQHPYCGGCGAELPLNPATKATYLASTLAKIATEMRDLLDESRDDRARRANELPTVTLHDEEE